jgi:hypothetical protein
MHVEVWTAEPLVILRGPELLVPLDLPMTLTDETQRHYDVDKDRHVERVRGAPLCPKSTEITTSSPKDQGAADQEREVLSARQP